MKLSIIVPVYNEEQTVSQVLSKLLEVNLPCSCEIIIVDDGSTDSTTSQISKLKSQNHNLKLKTIIHKTNFGKGVAIRNGIKAASGDYILIQDADLEYNPFEINELLLPILKNPRPRPARGGEKSKEAILAVYGSRFKVKRPVISPLYYLGNRILTILTNILYGVSLTDMETGYKLLPATFAKSMKLSSSRFNVEPEITAKLIKAKIPIIEIPISYKGRSHLAGKKLTPADAFSAIRTLVTLRMK